jgi:hypothetical protein
MQNLSKIAALAFLTAGVTGGLYSSPDTTEASSHREAPMITEDPSVDCTDVYAFVSPDQTNTVTLVANYIPLEEPSAGPNYYQFSDSALYEVHIDNDGDTNEDITYQFQFTTTTKNPNTFLYNTGPITAGTNGYDNLNVEQRYTVTKVVGDRRTGTKTVIAQDVLVAPANVGPKSIPDYDALVAPAIAPLAGGGQVFCGPRDDPFFINLGRAFDLLNIDPVLPGGLDNQCGAAPDHLKGFNVHTIALQLPITELTASGAAPADSADPNAIIGVWSTSSRRQVCLNRTRGRGQFTGGAWVQVSRLGMPLVNELVIARADKNVFNNSEPKDDGQFLNYVTDPELPGVLNALFGLTVPTSSRDDLVQVFLTGVPGLNQKGAPAEYLRLNMAIQPTPVATRSRLGVLGNDLDGFPNGRRLGDDVVDIALRVVAGSLQPTFNVSPNNVLGDTVCSNDLPFLGTFPYLATPHDGVTRSH